MYVYMYMYMYICIYVHDLIMFVNNADFRLQIIHIIDHTLSVIDYR